ncbi:hypothetical protein D3C77_653620 [compost metagenome]
MNCDFGFNEKITTSYVDDIDNHYHCDYINEINIYQPLFGWAGNISDNFVHGNRIIRCIQIESGDR